jgi:hypothetical protein
MVLVGRVTKLGWKMHEIDVEQQIRGQAIRTRE